MNHHRESGRVATHKETVPGPIRLGIPVLAIWLLAGCASAPPPVAQLALASAAVAHAAAAGAAEFAPTELMAAQEKLRRANLAVGRDDGNTALTLAEQAQIDAQVAEARTENAKAQKAIAALRESERALREEMARQPR